MIIRCWGARGSIPVSGFEYNEYGGDTTCMEIRNSSNEIIIIDAGSGIRELGNRLLSENIKIINMVFTHAHWDHLIGFPFFKLIYKEGIKINIYGCPYAQKAIHKMFEESTEPPFLPITYNDIKANLNFNEFAVKDFYISDIKISPINLSHPNTGFGYKFVENNSSFVFLTDNELAYIHPGGKNFEEYSRFCYNSDLLIHDSEYTDDEYKRTKTWGHSTYTDAAKLALESEVKQFGLYHHNQDRTDSQANLILEDCKKLIGEQNSSVNCFAVKTGTEIII